MTNEKRPKSDDFGRFHIQIMYIFRKTLIIKIDRGEREGLTLSLKPCVTYWYSSFAYSRLRLISELLVADMSLRICFQITDNEWLCLQYLNILRFKRSIFRTTILNIMGRCASEAPWSASQKCWLRPLCLSILFHISVLAFSEKLSLWTFAHDLYTWCRFHFIDMPNMASKVVSTCICLVFQRFTYQWDKWKHVAMQ